jgi:putative sigma-54 modulation protein
VRIEVRGRNVEVTDELREAVTQRFARVGKQVSELATLEVELGEEKNPRISDRMVAEATLALKGVKRRKRQRTRKLMQRLRGGGQAAGT